MWKGIRISILLVVLFWAAGHTWFDRMLSTSWKSTLWVGVFPVNADGSAVTQSYIDSLDEREYADIETFFEREAHRYGRNLSTPVHMALYRQARELPPELPAGAGIPQTMWWSLKLRWYGWHAADFGGRAQPRIRLFVLYHDPATLRTVPDSHGLQKGLLGVAHVFADRGLAATNNIVLAHELLHTLGASDKYEPGSGYPVYPAGFADPDRKPLLPQARAEIMAGRRALSPTEAQMSDSLREVVVGPVTAAEIRWIGR